MFPLLDFTIQKAQAHARGTGQGQRGQYGINPDVVDDDLVIHQSPVHVHGPMRAVALSAADRSIYHVRGYGDGLRRNRSSGRP